MATLEVTNMTDDLDGTTENVNTVSFVNPETGEKLELELSEKNAKALNKAIAGLEKFIAVARVVEAAVKVKAAPKGDGELAKVRKWAQENGYAVGDRGRIKADIVEAYKAAQSAVVVPVTETQVDAEPAVEVESEEVTEPTEAELLEVEHESQDAEAELSDAELMQIMADLDKETGGNFTVEDVAAKVDNA